MIQSESMRSLPTILMQAFTYLLEVMAYCLFVSFLFQVGLHAGNGLGVVIDGFLDVLQEILQSVQIDVHFYQLRQGLHGCCVHWVIVHIFGWLSLCKPSRWTFFILFSRFNHGVVPEFWSASHRSSALKLWLLALIFLFLIHNFRSLFFFFFACLSALFFNLLFNNLHVFLFVPDFNVERILKFLLVCLFLSL